MPLYYRSDTRPPEIVFGQGFIPRDASSYADPELYGGSHISLEELLYNWSAFSMIRPPSGELKVTDSLPESCISMTKNPASAAMFPLEEDGKSYIYVISMPDSYPLSIKILEDQKLSEKCAQASTFDYMEDPQYGSDASFARVYDMHELQQAQMKNFFEKGVLISQEIINEAAWALGSFEVGTGNVRGAQILGCIECYDRKLTGKDKYQREYKLGNYTENPNSFSFQEGEADNAILVLTELKSKQDLKTPTSEDALRKRRWYKVHTGCELQTTKADEQQSSSMLSSRMAILRKELPAISVTGNNADKEALLFEEYGKRCDIQIVEEYLDRARIEEKVQKEKDKVPPKSSPSH